MRIGGHIYAYADDLNTYGLSSAVFNIVDMYFIDSHYKDFIDDPKSVRDINRGRDDAKNTTLGRIKMINEVTKTSPIAKAGNVVGVSTLLIYVFFIRFTYGIEYLIPRYISVFFLHL